MRGIAKWRNIFLCFKVQGYIDYGQKKKKKINTFWVGVEKRENVKSVEETMAMAMAMAQ